MFLPVTENWTIELVHLRNIRNELLRRETNRFISTFVEYDTVLKKEIPEK